MYDLIIIGGGPSALSCALVLGSAGQKEYMKDKKIAIIANQKASDMKAAVLNNLYGVEQGVKGKDFLANSLKQLDMFKNIEGLEKYVEKHINTPEGMERFALKNKNLLVDEKAMYVAGVLSGCSSQVAIASGTGADVAVQLLTKWNGDKFDHHHDK